MKDDWSMNPGSGDGFSGGDGSWGGAPQQEPAPGEWNPSGKTGQASGAWNPTGGTGTPARGERRTAPGGKGKWYWPLTLLSLGLVCVLSLLMCFATRNVKERPLWLMGLIFMVPAGTMFFSAMLLEFSAGVMTPSGSRKPQVIVAVVATALTFLVGCLCDFLYLHGGFLKDAGANFVFAVDWGDAMADPTGNEEETCADVMDALALKLLARMPRYADAGLLTFGWETEKQVPILKTTGEGKMAISGALAGRPEDPEGASFVSAAEDALAMAEAAGNGLPVNLLILTSGLEAAWEIDENGQYRDLTEDPALKERLLSNKDTCDAQIARCKDAGVKVFVITPDGTASEGLRKLAEESGGKVIPAAAALEDKDLAALVPDGDMLRAHYPVAKVLTLVMFLLEGLVIGICISIMLSRQGQRRWQMLISPLAGIACFALVKLAGQYPVSPIGGEKLWWLWEGLCFLPLGCIFMRRNDGAAAETPPAPADPWSARGGGKPAAPQERKAPEKNGGSGNGFDSVGW